MSLSAPAIIVQQNGSYPVFNKVQLNALQNDIQSLAKVKEIHTVNALEVENKLFKKRYDLLSHFYGEKKKKIEVLETENTILKRKLAAVVGTMNEQETTHKSRKVEYESKIKELENRLARIQDISRVLPL